MFGQSHRRPWRNKASASNVVGYLRKDSESKPGDRIATDQIVSAQPGLVPQEKGTPTRARVWGATVFVDCATNWAKVQLMQDASKESTLEAKKRVQTRLHDS